MTPDDVLRRALVARVYDVARETQLQVAPQLSARTGNSVLLKREDEQPIHSFKLRGAYNRMVRLGTEQLARGVVCASAGNHAQGVALAAERLGVRAVIVMPRTTPAIKIDAVRALGAQVRLHGDNYDEATHEAERLAAEGLTFVHPYDDPDVIAGQATIGLEILKQTGGELDAVFVAVGGGGLIAGIASVIKELRPEIRVIGVEPEDAAALAESLVAGERVRLDRVGRFADGVAVRQVGRLTYDLARATVDEVVVVSNDAICGAIKEIFEDVRAVLEPAGALAYAGLKAWAERTGTRDARLCAIACGANINFDSLRHVAERAELGERREAIFAVTIPERPGSFRDFCRIIGERHITEFNYRLAAGPEAHVFVGVGVAGDAERAAVAQALREGGYAVEDLTQNETAKLHVRHMVGGRNPAAAHERLLSFTFPERPAALMHFLEAMRQPWNISLFHYRNHGSDYGRVLAGIQVPPEEETDFRAFLARLGYEAQDESQNPACRLFLGA